MVGGLNKAFAFARLLGNTFESYEDSDKFYKWVLERLDDNPYAWAGRAILYRRWANSDKATPEIHARSSYLVRRASELLKRELGKGNDFQTFLNLADLYIATCDWAEAREQLDYADSFCGGSRLKRAKVTERRGLICYCLEEHAEAEKHFRQALLVKPGYLTLQCNLGNALLQLKKFKDAKDEFARVLKLAPENIDALLGAAQVSIELAGDSDPDQFQIGVDHLSYALEYGWHREAGLKRLSISETAKIYYVRGYARTKSYEADASRATLTLALKDFQKCKELDPKDSKAPAAIEKITKFMRRGMRESLLEVWGPLVISIFGALVFLFLQLDFFFPGKLLPQHSPTDAMGAEASRRSSPGSRRSGGRR
jgi:tetratricopeptide (TPR) repeat protein